MKNRGALSIQRDVLFAIFLRDLKSRFSGYALGTVWLFLEPLLLVVMLLTLLDVRGMGEFGYGDPPVFILAGVIAFRQLWLPTQRAVSNVPKGFAPYKMFRQVKVFDVMLANALVSGGLFLLVTSSLGLGLWWLGYDAMPAEPLEIFVVITATWLLSLGVGLLFAIAKAASKELEKLLEIIQFPLFLLSAVLFPMTTIPASYHDTFALNPLVHMSEWMRQAWIEQYVSPVLDIPYFLGFMGIVLLFGMMGYRLTHRRILSQ